jgi:DNA-directed RNA polymerase specialized sigma24 family protein
MQAGEAPFDFEAMFRAQYGRIARVIARVVCDPARAEELAVEVFLKLWRNRKAQGDKAEGWLYRAAVRKGLDELRRQTRRARYEHSFGFGRQVPPPKISAAPPMNGRKSVWCWPLSSLAKRSCYCCAAMASATTKWHLLSI